MRSARISQSTGGILTARASNCFPIVDARVDAALWLVGEQRGTFWRVPCCIVTLAKANIWKAEFRVHCKHTLIRTPTRSFFFAANNCKLAVECVHIRQRKFARGIIWCVFKIGKHHLVLAFLFFLFVRSYVEIGLRVRTVIFARAVKNLFLSEINSWSAPTSFHAPLRSNKIFMTALSEHVFAGKTRRFLEAIKYPWRTSNRTLAKRFVRIRWLPIRRIRLTRIILNS